MKWNETRTPDDAQKGEIISLWNNEYPSELILTDMVAFNTFLETLEYKEHLMITDENGKLKGWLLCFIRDKERWFVMAVDSTAQGKGLGSALLNWAKKRHPPLNG